MRDRPGGPDRPDEQPDEPDEDGDRPNRAGAEHSERPDLPGKSDQPRENDQQAGTDQPRRWYEFELTDPEEPDAERDTLIAFQEKQQLKAEGFDEELLTELYGTDAELGFAEVSDEPEQSETPEQADEPEPFGWDVPDISVSPDRPDLDEIHLSDKRREHIAKNHISGAQKSNKTEFPPGWDEDTIMDTVTDVARNPTETPWQQERSGLWVVDGTRDGVTVRAIVRPDGGIISGYPLSGDGVVRNPRKDQA